MTQNLKIPLILKMEETNYHNLVIEAVFSSMREAMLRTKEVIVGWCNGNESDEDEDVEEPVQRNTKLELLPSTSK